MAITHVIVPAAGLGTRFAPYTTVVAKEMLPLITKPAIHHSIEEGVLSGITNFCMVTTARKPALTHYCDLLEQQEYARFSYIHQQNPRGLGHALWTARTVVQDNYFGVMLPDDIVVADTPCLKQLIALAQQENASVIALQEIPREYISAYGVVSYSMQLSKTAFELSNVVEKPAAHEAPSNLAIVGRYIFSSKIFSILENTPPSKNGEIQLTDAIIGLINAGERVIGHVFEGTRYDIGTPTGWIHAVNDYAKKQNLL